MARQGVLIVLSGPSGTGKGTICKQLLQDNSQLKYSVSVTTRQPRCGEQNGINYWFCSHAEFEAMIDNDELLEWAQVYGNFYGTPRKYVMQLLDNGHDVILEIDTQGAMKVKTKFPQGVYVYLSPPSLEELADRIKKRDTDSSESIRERLNCVSKELAVAIKYDYLVVNEKIEDAVKQIITIIDAEKLRVNRNIDLLNKVAQSGP